MKFCVKTEVKRRFQDWLTIVTVVFWSEMQLRLAQKRRPSWQDSGGVRNLSLGKVSSGLSGATTADIPCDFAVVYLLSFLLHNSFFVLGEMHSG